MAVAGISIHFSLHDFPRDTDIVDEAGPVRSEEVPGIPVDLLEQAVDFHTYDWIHRGWLDRPVSRRMNMAHDGSNRLTAA